MGEFRGKDCQGRCIKDTWTEPKVGMIEGGRRRWVGRGGGSGGGKMETTVLEQQLKKRKKKKITV